MTLKFACDDWLADLLCRQSYRDSHGTKVT